MSQRNQLARIMEIDRQVRAGKYPNADSLARDLGVSRRVIFKDRAFMIDRLQAPLATDRRRGGWYYTEPTYTLPNLMITEGELLALFLSMELAQRYMGTAFQELLGSAVQKLQQAFKGDVSVSLETLGAYYSFMPPPLTEINPELLTTIYRAIRERRLLHICYLADKTGEITERVVEPYHLTNAKGAWYLLAFDRLRNDKRQFHIGRIQAWRMLPDKFARRSSIVIADWLASFFGAEGGAAPTEVVIRFDAYQAKWIRERRWHPTEQREEHADGSLTLRMKIGGLGELQRWVMQYGGHAEVLAPDWLRRAIAEEARKMSQIYGAE